ncbi:MAG TPA: hypothetical protein VIV60_25120 [Polyangiaceae bacterium]
MMQRLKAKVALGLVVGAVSGAVWGCADNDSTLFVVGVAKIESDCTYSPSASTTLLPQGVYDVGFDGSYQVGLILGNQMASRGAKARSRVETSRITLEGAEVRLSLPSGGEAHVPFTAPGAGFVDVGLGQDPGYGILSIVIIPELSNAVIGTALTDGYVIADIKAFGKTLGGQEVESNVFKFPVKVCRGCLVTYPASELDADGNCLGSAATEASSGPCNWGQDTPVVCSSCAARYDVCRFPGK